MRRTRIVAAALLAASLTLAGCGADDTGDSKSADSKGLTAPQDGAREGAADTASGAESGAGGAQKPADAKSPASLPRQHIVRTAELHVEVADATKALAAAKGVVERASGHVADETTERVDDTHITSRVVLRVPQEKYAAVLAELSGTGRLLSRTAGAKDVTEQVVDVESRIATQRASVERVRKLMERATALSDVVSLEGELSRRQADLESLLAQQASLKDRTSLATITLGLTEPEGPGKPEGDDRPGVLEALGGGWDALVASLAWLVVVLAALAPWLGVLAALYATWRLLVRPRLRKRRPSGAGTAAREGAGTAPLPAPRPDGAPAAARAPEEG
ncbi:DUF4349 domain-containing protein [Streptomyces sp. NPDC048604]|uniref:DUF4349 domain-containing protein n=1 Tax=Streptomyces sp. NPDC048604 TaxID=3365578 RepID=UPI0037238E97